MADSVDRVFSHALNTVTKIRVGSEKPPSHIRLNLYGLYKQSMEGDVSGIMSRPVGESEEIRRAQEKWDAWKQQNGLPRMEAKQRYINKLIETMHQYASRSPEARELIAELEFVWEQVKSNVSSQGAGDYEQRLRNNTGAASAMRAISPLSASGDSGEEVQEEGEEDEEEDEEEEAGVGDDKDRYIEPDGPQSAQSKDLDKLWQRTVEQAIIRMTTEIAALREQLETQHRFSSYNPPKRIVRLLLGFFWSSFKHIAIDFMLLALLLLWLRRKRFGRNELKTAPHSEDRRIEGVIKLLIGNAMTQIRKVDRGKLYHTRHKSASSE